MQCAGQYLVVAGVVVWEWGGRRAEGRPDPCSVCRRLISDILLERFAQSGEQKGGRVRVV